MGNLSVVKMPRLTATIDTIGNQYNIIGYYNVQEIISISYLIYESGKFLWNLITKAYTGLRKTDHVVLI